MGTDNSAVAVPRPDRERQGTVDVRHLPTHCQRLITFRCPIRATALVEALATARRAAGRAATLGARPGTRRRRAERSRTMDLDRHFTAPELPDLIRSALAYAGD
jgi:hypothetical protein